MATDLILGIDALCAPVLHADGHIVLRILAMGRSATFGGSWDGQIAKALKRCAAEISRRIGRVELLFAIQETRKGKK